MDHSHRWVWNIPMDHLWGGLTSRVVNSVRASLREHTRRCAEKLKEGLTRSHGDTEVKKAVLERRVSVAPCENIQLY
jgi:hypothetical protein